MKKILTLSTLFGLLLGCSGSSPSNEDKTQSNDQSLQSQTTQSLSGTISGEIQIDGPSNGSDYFPEIGVPLNTGATQDWVKDLLPNSGTNCLSPEDVASCIEANITGASGGIGNWNGMRLIDGISGGDQNIFLSGGKENDTSTWNVGPGSVGSSKYDISQTYLASNANNLYFGMERSGNNGTTAFDFEFNQLPPASLPSCPQSPQIPCRSIGDVLFTFEMQGSGGSGSATPHYYTWNGTTYVEGSISGILSSINTSISTAGPPWGHVDSHGNWILGNIDRFTFAEAVAPLSLLPGVDLCGGQSFVQVRTRSSAVATSDLKDTSKVFQFFFNSISSSAILTPSCDGTLGYSALGLDINGNPIANPACSWTFSNGMTSNVCSGSLIVGPGEYSGTVEVTDPSAPACSSTSASNTVTLLNGLVVSLVPANETPACPMSSDAVTYNAVVSGGNGNYTFVWSDPTCTGSSCTIDPVDSQFCYDKALFVTVNDNSNLCPSVVSETETYNKITTITVSNN